MLILHELKKNNKYKINRFTNLYAKLLRKKSWSLIHGLSRFFDYWSLLAETLQFEDLAVKSFFFFIMCIFLGIQILNCYQIHFLWMLRKKNLKTHFAEKIQNFFHKNVHVIKKQEIIDRKVFKFYHFSKVFPNVDENALFWRGHWSKNLPKLWIRLQFFPLVVWHTI